MFIKSSRYQYTLQARKKQSRILAAAFFRASDELKSLSYHRRAEATYLCSDAIVTAREAVVTQWRCHERLCPICAGMQSRVLARNAHLVLKRALQDRSIKAYMITLTQLNCSSSELRGRIDDMIKAWRSITHDKKLIREVIVGSARTIEVTVGRDEQSYHPHVHVIALMKTPPAHMLRAGFWAELWRVYMGTDAYQSVRPVCHITKIRKNLQKKISTEAAAGAEIAKYVTKISTLLAGDRERVYRHVMAIDGAVRSRQLRSYSGIWLKIRRDLRLSDEDKAPEAKVIDSDIPLIVWRWAGEAYIPERLDGLALDGSEDDLLEGE